MAQLHFYMNGEKHILYDLPLEEIYLKLTKFNNRSEFISKLDLDENITLLLYDNYKTSKRILFKEDIKNLKNLISDRTFLRYLVQKKFYLFSKRARNNVRYGYSNKLTIDLIYKEINDLKRNDELNEYYTTISEIYECYENFVNKYKPKANIEDEILEPKITEEEKEEKEEFLEPSDFNKSKYNIFDQELYDFFDCDSFEDRYEKLNALVINLDDLEESEELVALFERCKVNYTKNCTFSNLKYSDFIIYIGNYNKNVLQDLIRNNKPLIFLNISKRIININNDMLTSINGFNEEIIVNLIEKIYKKQKRDSHEY